MPQQSRVQKNARSLSACALVACALLLGVAVARGQEQQPAADALLPPQPAPPPMRYLPDALRAQLNGARDAKERTHLALAEADAHLTRAEQHTTAEQFDAAAAELGIYEAIITDAISYLQSSGRIDKRVRDLFKQLEQTIFNDTGRIEAMRRNTPPEYAGNVRAAFIYARDARASALNAFYGNTVLRESAGPEKNSPTPKP